MKRNEVTFGAIAYTQQHLDDYRETQKKADWLVIASDETTWLPFVEGQEKPVQGDELGTGVLASVISKGEFEDYDCPFVYKLHELMTQKTFTAKCAKIDLNRIDVEGYQQLHREKSQKFQKVINQKKQLFSLLFATNAVESAHELPKDLTVSIHISGEKLIVDFVVITFDVSFNEDGVVCWGTTSVEQCLGLDRLGFEGVAQLTICLAALERLWSRWVRKDSQDGGKNEKT